MLHQQAAGGNSLLKCMPFVPLLYSTRVIKLFQAQEERSAPPVKFDEVHCFALRDCVSCFSFAATASMRIWCVGGVDMLMRYCVVLHVVLTRITQNRPHQPKYRPHQPKCPRAHQPKCPTHRQPKRGFSPNIALSVHF